jgi:5'-nucleotidase (lipoprotein e(P4) family)
MMGTRVFAGLALALALAAPVAARPPAHHRAATAGTVVYIPPPAPPQLHGMQYLYGSGEAAALTRQSWHVLADYVAARLQAHDKRSVVLAAEATLQHPTFIPCGDKPPAIVLDVDETSLLNLGVEYDDLVANRPVFDTDVWGRWERAGADKVVPTPGAREALDRLRGLGVTVIFNTNRDRFATAESEKALNDAGLGPAVHGQTLYLAGDDNMGSLKDGRRRTIAAHYCVLAMAGDQLVDFSDLFDLATLNIPERRAAIALPGIEAMWGNGWFVMPNPVYGSALQGGPDDIFPKDKQWRDPGPGAPEGAH